MHYRYSELLSVAIVQLVVYVAFILLVEHALARFCTDNVWIALELVGMIACLHYYNQVFRSECFTTIKFFFTPD